MTLLSFFAIIYKMLISHSHKFIFCRVAKVASHSIIKAFEKDPDISTERIDNSHNRNGFCHNHIPLFEIRSLVGDKIYNSYFKFSFVRNSWERMASAYLYDRQYFEQEIHRGNLCRDQVISFIGSNFFDYIKLLKKTPTPIRPKYSMPQCKFSEGADFIGDMGSLQEDFNIACDRIGTSHKPLPHRNAIRDGRWLSSLDPALPKGPAQRLRLQMYNEEAQNIVASHFAEDIEKFNFTFDQE